MSPRRHAKAPPAGPPPPRSNPLVLAWRFVQTTLLILVILYVAALVISHTSGFRALAEERLGRALHAKIRVGKSHLTPGLDVVLGELKLEETGVVVRARAECARAVMRWHLPRPLGSGALPEIQLQGARISMAWQGDAWHPRAFAEAADGVAKWMNIPLPAKPKTAGRARDRMDDFMPAAADEKPSWRGPRVRVALEDGEVTWWTDRPEPVAAVTGLRLAVTPLEAPDRPMMHYLLEAREVSARGEILAAPLRLESLDTGDQRLMLEMMAGQRPTGHAP